jgi:hypothetical protein
MKLKIEVEYAEFHPRLLESIDHVLDELRNYGEIKLAKLEGLPSEITLEES